MRARHKWFIILMLNLLINQVHTVWDCKIKYVMFMLSLNIIEAFNQVSHIKLLHMLKMKRTSSYIIEWTCNFLKDWKTLLIFDEQMSVLFYFFIKCMQSMTMTLSKRCMYVKLHVIWSKLLLYIFSLINHIDSLNIQALSLKLLQLYFRFSSFLRILRVLLFRF